MGKIYIVTYHGGNNSQTIEGVFVKFSDAETFANELRDEAQSLGDWSHYVTNIEHDVK